MATTKRIVCLADSRKLGGRCIAGMEVAQGQRVGWVRPVTARESQELLQCECLCDDGSCAGPLDVVDIRLLRAQPSTYQQENWLLDPSVRWRKVGRASWNDLQGLVDPVERLWINGQSTYNGENDRIPTEQAQQLTSSLRLLHVDRLKIHVWQPGEAFGNPKRRVQARFRYAGAGYRLWVTDLKYENAYLAKPNGEYHLGESYLTVSISEPHDDGFCYKLVAAIIEREKTVDA